MLKPLRKTTYEDACHHGQDLLAQLREEDDFCRAQDRAATLGVEIVCDVRHTYVPDMEGSYSPTDDFSGQLPFGYAMELWFDMVRDGAVLRSQGEHPIQLSYSVTVVRHINLLVTQRVSFTEYEDLFSEDPLIPTLEDYLDRIEEEGAAPSPFVRDSLCPTTPRGELGLLVGRDAVGDGAYVELSDSPYNGTFGGSNSLYFSSDAFFPYRLLLLAIPGEPVFADLPLNLTLEQTIDYANILEEVPHALRSTRCFSDLLSHIGVGAYTPPPRAASLLDNLTFLRRKEFLEDVETLLNHLHALIENEKALTLIP